MKVVLGFLIAVLCLGAATLAAQGSGLDDTTLRDTVMSEYQAGYAEGGKCARDQLSWFGYGGLGTALGGCAGSVFTAYSLPGSAIGSAVGGCNAMFVGFSYPDAPDRIPDSSASYRLGFVNGYKKKAAWRNVRSALGGMILAGIFTVYLTMQIRVSLDM